MPTLCLFDEAMESETRYHPPDDRLTLLSGALSDAPGLSYHPEFITDAEERHLLRRSDDGDWSDYWSRRTKFYGFKYDRAAREIDTSGKAEPVPDWTGFVRCRLVDRGIMERLPNQVGINEYLPGQGIAGHIDYFGGTVVSLTLGSGCVMDVVQPDTKRTVSLWLAPRSIIVLKGDARNLWEHGIARRQKDIVDGHAIYRKRRVSLTFRDVMVVGAH